MEGIVGEGGQFCIEWEGDRRSLEDGLPVSRMTRYPCEYLDLSMVEVISPDE